MPTLTPEQFVNRYAGKKVVEEKNQIPSAALKPEAQESLATVEDLENQIRDTIRAGEDASELIGQLHIAREQYANDSAPDFGDFVEGAKEVVKDVGIGVAKGVGKAAKDFGIGTLKGVAETSINFDSLLQGLGQRTLALIDPFHSLEEIQAQTGVESLKKGTPENEEIMKQLEAEGFFQKAGKFTEGLAEFAVPLSKVGKAQKLRGPVEKLTQKMGRVGERAGTAAGVATAQEGEVGEGAVIAGVTEAALPGVGKALQPAKRFMNRLFRVGSAKGSGVSMDVINQIVDNPKLAKEKVAKLVAEGNDKILREESKTVLNGMKNIRREASDAYGAGIEKLSKTQIDSSVVSNAAKSSLRKSGIEVTEKGFDLAGAEFTSKASKLKAQNLINDVNSIKDFDGKNLRKVIDMVDNSKWKTATSDDRISYNIFADDLAKSLRNSVKKATPELEKMNKSYSKDVQLVEAVEGILGKSDFRNETEIINTARKLDNLFSKKALDPATVDKFFKRAGIDTTDIRTQEAVRKISFSDVTGGGEGFGVGQIKQTATTALLPPEAVRDFAIRVGIQKEALSNILEKVSPALHGVLLEIIAQGVENQEG